MSSKRKRDSESPEKMSESVVRSRDGGTGGGGGGGGTGDDVLEEFDCSAKGREV